jgi:hypothetical protein
MTRRVLASLALLVTTSACGDRTTTDEPRLDSAASAVAPEIPETPRVASIDIGLAVDSSGRLLGGGTQRFQQPQTLIVGVLTQFVDAGAPMTARLMQGSRTIESVAFLAGVPDGSRAARAHAELPAAGSLQPGDYDIEVLLGEVSQGIRRITILE